MTPEHRAERLSLARRQDMPSILDFSFALPGQNKTAPFGVEAVCEREPLQGRFRGTRDSSTYHCSEFDVFAASRQHNYSPAEMTGPLLGV